VLPGLDRPETPGRRRSPGPAGPGAGFGREPTGNREKVLVRGSAGPRTPTGADGAGECEARGDRVNDDSFGDLGDELVMVVPPYSRFLRSVRLIAADAAVRAGLDCDETDDFRLAVDELCHTMMGATDHPLRLSFQPTRVGVSARGVTRARTGARPAIGELSATIITALADAYELDVVDGELQFIVHRNHTGARAR
jgi:hypothetical protein